MTACSLSACSLLLADDWLTKNQKEITDEAMLSMCRAIRSRDADAVKELFAADDIADVDGFDESVKKLLDYVTGDDPKARRVSSGSDGAGMGGYPKDREFGGVRYDIETSTDKFKVVFDYRSYYSPRHNYVDKNKIGFINFDIINVKNDRENDHPYYSGHPGSEPGIHFDCPTLYFDDDGEYAFKKAYFSVGEAFDPILINDADDLTAFCAESADLYTPSTRDDGMGYADVASQYDAEFFDIHSLYVVGFYHDGGGLTYVPQWLYIGDFVMVRIASFEYDERRDEYVGDFPENGVIFFIELPAKVPTDIELKIMRNR